MRKIIFFLFVTLFVISPVFAGDTDFSDLEKQYNVEIRELPQWASLMAGCMFDPSHQQLLGLSFPEDRKILLFTEDLEDEIRWDTFYHELGHVELNTYDEELADEYAFNYLNQ